MNGVLVGGQRQTNALFHTCFLMQLSTHKRGDSDFSEITRRDMEDSVHSNVTENTNTKACRNLVR